MNQSQEKHGQELLPSTNVLLDISAERLRQRRKEGWTDEHDDEHDAGEIARAAACYSYAAFQQSVCEEAVLPTPLMWPWSAEWWKPTTARRNLIKAGALIVAEIERLDRVEK